MERYYQPGRQLRAGGEYHGRGSAIGHPSGPSQKQFRHHGNGLPRHVSLCCVQKVQQTMTRSDCIKRHQIIPGITYVRDRSALSICPTLPAFFVINSSYMVRSLGGMTAEAADVAVDKIVVVWFGFFEIPFVDAPLE